MPAGFSSLRILMLCLLALLGQSCSVPPNDGAAQEATESATTRPLSGLEKTPLVPGPTQLPGIRSPRRGLGDVRRDTDMPPESKGLHFTAEEVEMWRSRARRGPYRRKGDVSPGSPGDWNRISQSARLLLTEDLEHDLWKGPDRLSKRGCVRQISGRRRNNNPPIDTPSSVRDAAFVWLVTGDERYREPVKRFMLAQSAEPALQFSNRELYCIGAMKDGSPGFDLANWLTKLLYAYDYLGPDSFDAEERQQLNEWFYGAAEFFATDVERAFDELFVDRQAGDYTLTEIGASRLNPRIGYFGSASTYPLHRYYNNRKAVRLRYVAVAAAKLSSEDYVPPTGRRSLNSLKVSAAMFVKEWLTYSVFEEGWFGEFERWTEDAPDRGWTYAGDLLGPVLTIAETFSRAGDDSLYHFSTTDGALGTESKAPKSLIFAAESYAKYVDGTFERYGTDKAKNVGLLAYRIDSVDRLDSDPEFAFQDVQLAILNPDYEDEYLQDTYLRREDRPPYRPEDALEVGQHTAWNGDWGTYPGVLFMFGQLHDAEFGGESVNHSRQ